MTGIKNIEAWLKPLSMKFKIAAYTFIAYLLVFEF